jgi:hypothetical protein
MPFWRNLLDQVPWDEDLATQPDRVAAELARTRGLVETWAQEVDAVGRHAAVDAEGTAVEQVRRLADRMRTIAMLLDIQHDLVGGTDRSAGEAAWASADDLDRIAGRMTSGDQDATDVVAGVDRAESAASATPGGPQRADRVVSGSVTSTPPASDER